MSAHTPGPWELWLALDASPHGVFLREGLGGIDIPHYGFDDEKAAVEMEANAHLIAAAPELLAALQATEFALVVADGYEDKTDLSELLVTVRTAIAKARGE